MWIKHHTLLLVSWQLPRCSLRTLQILILKFFNNNLWDNLMMTLNFTALMRSLKQLWSFVWDVVTDLQPHRNNRTSWLWMRHIFNHSQQDLNKSLENCIGDHDCTIISTLTLKILTPCFVYHVGCSVHQLALFDWNYTCLYFCSLTYPS